MQTPLPFAGSILVADGMDLWQATAGAEERVKAAERLFDHSVDLEAARRFLGVRPTIW